MRHVDQFIPVTQAKNRFLDLIRKLQTQKEIVAITRDGIPAAVLLSSERYEELIETLEILSDQKAMGSLRRSLKQARGDRWVSHESVFSKNHE